ncbi:coth protein-domain-containing protein [Phascolomyces articulosus]|uniref:Coth protein-domain-containing protein n=1 Tax=Phascolomyces articulosus TaxID=60185 RepID=A0AAD5JSM5_9FUNG|nr:coth protein-domain-containing protein [Phascolomyces articulosus]
MLYYTSTGLKAITLAQQQGAPVQVESHPVTYQVVISPPDAKTNTVGVAIGQDVYGLEPDPKVPMLYKGIGPSSQPYRYVILDNNENKSILHYERFERPAIQEATETFHEMYGRPWNKLHIPPMPRVYDFDSSNLDPVEDPYAPIDDPAASELFQEGTIVTLHFKVDEEDAQQMHTQKFDEKKSKIRGDMTFISYNDVQQFANVSLKVGGHSSRSWAKVPYKIKIPRKSSPNGLYRRWSLKLRSESTDPTMMREKLYNDLLESSGVVAARGVYARLYINGLPIGLYYLADDSSSSSFVRETMHHNEPETKVGHIIQGDAGKGDYAANFAYLGEDVEAYDPMVYQVKSSKKPEKQAVALSSLVDFMTFIKEYDTSAAPNDASVLNDWTPQLDVVRYIRQLALEWIGGSWDAIQYSGNNFAIYQKRDSTQWTFIPMDFDYTFGNGLEEDQGELMTGDWTRLTEGRKIHSYLWEKLKEMPYMVHLYEDTLRQINARASNPETLLKRIDGLAYMLQREVLWDTSLERMTTGVTRPWEASEFLKHLEQGTDAQDEWIGLKQWVVEKHQAITNMKDHAAYARSGLGVGEDMMPDIDIGMMESQDTIEEMVAEAVQQ